MIRRKAGGDPPSLQIMPPLKIKHRSVDIDSLKPHPENPRRGKVAEIEESIQKNGLYRAVVVQESTQFILAGNHTWQAAKNLGQKRIPVGVVDVDDATAKRIMLADNRTSDLATMDDTALLSLLQELNAGDGIEGTGYDDDFLADLLASQPEKGSGDGGDGGGGGDGSPTITYLLVFDDEQQQSIWYDFLDYLKDEHGGSTHAERLVAYILALDIGEKS